MRNPRISIIGTAGVPANYGGFETMTDQLIDQLRSEFDFTVYCSTKNYSKEAQVPTYKGAKLVHLPFSANGVSSIIYDFISMLHAMWTADILLILGVPGCFFLPFIKYFTSVKTIVNIDGLEWRRNKWSGFAKRFLKWSEEMAIDFADSIVTDNKGIQDYVTEEYGIKSACIAYGGEQAKAESPTKEDVNNYPFVNDSYAIKVCRIEPENNVDMVLEAFAQQDDTQLVVVGNWNNSVYGIQLKAKYENIEHIHLLDPIYDIRTINMLRSNALLYIHGHSAGGTNPSLVEAMHLELPIMTFDVVYNRSTTRNKALYFSDTKSLLGKLEYLQYLPLGRVRLDMLAIAKKEYTWNAISLQYAEQAVKLLIPSQQAVPSLLAK